MNFSLLIGPLTGGQRRVIEYWDEIGGTNIVVKSASDVITGFCFSHGFTPALNLYTCVPSAIAELNPNVLSFKMYPNPIEDNLLNIVYELKKDAPVKFRILDVMGKQVYLLEEKSSAGQHTEQLNIDNLSIGVYFIEVTINDIGDTQKLVKIR